VVGPGSSTDNAVARFDGTTGKLIQNTAGFTCDDNFNIKMGDDTAVNRLIHMQSGQDITLFLEADATQGPTEQENPTLILTHDGNLTYAGWGLMDDGVGDTTTNYLAMQVSTTSLGNMDGIYFRTGGVHTATPKGTPVTSFTTQPQDAMRIRNSDQKVITYAGLMTNLIEERTSANGVLIDSVRLKDGSIELPSTTSTAGLIKWNGTTQMQNRNGSNLFLGTSGNFTTTGTYNYGLGNLALRDITTGTDNICLGRDAGILITSGPDNILLGRSCGGNISGANGRRNIGIGTSALESLGTSGQSNIGIGYFAGSSLSGTDSNNICIGNSGSPGLNNNIRVGTSGTHTSYCTYTTKSLGNH
jgi:hypothetical protein